MISQKNKEILDLNQNTNAIKLDTYDKVQKITMLETQLMNATNSLNNL